MTTESTIDYETLAQDAMRGVVRTVLIQVAKTGLPGEHHFYISFDTQSAGVNLSKRLRERYPEEMTIVLQHRFWDLLVADDRFEVKLTFDGIPERLVVPFKAIKVFFDPSVRYGLQFEDPEMAGEHPADPRSRTGRDGAAALPSIGGDDVRPGRTGGAASGKKPRPAKPARRADLKLGEGAAASVPAVPAPAAKPQVAPPAAAPASARTTTTTTTAPQPAAVATADTAEPAKPAAASGAQIVSLDAFRKK